VVPEWWSHDIRRLPGLADDGGGRFGRRWRESWDRGGSRGRMWSVEKVQGLFCINTVMSVIFGPREYHFTK
jgi:hypothetical protein